MYQLIEWWNGGYSEEVVFEGTLEECEERFEYGNGYGDDGMEIRDPDGRTVREG